MKCPKCGADLKEGNSFCGKCGNKMAAESSTSNQPQAQTKTQTQTSSTTSSVTQTPTEAPKKKKSTGVKILLGCLIAFVVFAVVGGIVGYILVKKGIEKAQKEIEKTGQGWTDQLQGLENVGENYAKEIENEQKKIENEADNEVDNENSSSPSTTGTKSSKEVVTDFMNCTLGTISGKCPSSDKDKAASGYLAEELQVKYNTEDFIPTTYCIQDGPGSVRIDSATEAGGYAYVLVSAKYGTDDYQPFWNFVLITENGQWKIKEIQCLNF